MARTKPSEQLSRAEIERFIAAAEALHKSIVGPLLAYHSEHYQALREVHRPLLKSVQTITGKRAPFIQPNMTGPAQPREKPPG
ncbi:MULTISPECIES: hypothetical protein [unclassified Mesorhizobium]|uniref:hypothetical protein n=1 Tax=unclassified Mesorhizobium TaxID=325217 RepID=UPI0003CE9B3B|nr:MULTISPECIES: hypothetical protein [unclassified Mesorhizobium]ESX99872.1 hypothetical protein X752_29335 [Mesorhizobium sp. LNJC398B00]ESY19269.1 hypothetical protein X751_10690 [Mesorhizobium sp. LNJC395A00]ESY39714.1 hypothetical protein X746_27805 [Mesorhizobium sp. LNJC380A00]WJI76965.1 hypothetical protein NLY37_09820 [Mesorhizobium sp. C395A]